MDLIVVSFILQNPPLIQCHCSHLQINFFDFLFQDFVAASKILINLSEDPG